MERNCANKQANILRTQAKKQAAKDQGFPSSSLCKLLFLATEKANAAIQAIDVISKPRQEWSPPELSDKQMQEEMEDGLEISDVAGIFEDTEDGLKICHAGAGHKRKLTPAQLK